MRHFFHILFRKSLLATLFLVYGFCQAQEEFPTFYAALSGNTWGTDILPHRKVSWENLFTFESESKGQHTAILPTTIIRYGLFKNVELQVSTGFQVWKEEEDEKHTFGVSPLTVRAKFRLYDGTRILPSIGFLAELQSPHIGSKDLLPAHLAPSLYLLFENEITDWFGISYNVGAEWDGETATPTTFLSLCLNFGITDNLAAYVETFNYLHPKDDNRYMTSVGLSWFASRRVQLYLTTDLDFLRLGKYYAVNGGVAWLIN